MELGLCFGNAECIRKREEAKALQAQYLQQQQYALQQALSKSSGGLTPLAATGIIVAIAAITAIVLYMIKKNKKK